MPEHRISIHAANRDHWHQLLNFAEWLDWQGIGEQRFARVENTDHLDDGTLWVWVQSNAKLRKTMKLIEQGILREGLCDRVEITLDPEP